MKTPGDNLSIINPLGWVRNKKRIILDWSFWTEMISTEEKKYRGFDQKQKYHFTFSCSDFRDKLRLGSWEIYEMIMIIYFNYEYGLLK